MRNTSTAPARLPASERLAEAKRDEQEAKKVLASALISRERLELRYSQLSGQRADAAREHSEAYNDYIDSKSAGAAERFNLALHALRMAGEREDHALLRLRDATEAWHDASRKAEAASKEVIRLEDDPNERMRRMLESR